MPIIQFAEYGNHPGRQYRNVRQDPTTYLYTAEVDEVLPGETEIVEATSEGASD